MISAPKNRVVKRGGVNMTGKQYVKMLVEEFHSTTVATIGTDGYPQTRVIDMMLWDENGIMEKGISTKDSERIS